MSGHQFGLIEGFFVRGGLSNGGSLTVADIYNDFVFSNGPIPNGSLSMTLALAGAGIAANTPYLLTFYSFDPLASQGSHSVSFDGASGTAGSAPAISYDSSVNPTTDDQYATTGIFTSDGAGVLTISLADNWTGATESTGIRLNGFVVGDPGASAFAITEIVYSPDDDMVTLTWISRPGAAYAVKFSTDMTNWDADLDDGVAADAGETTTRTFGIGGLASADGKLFFRIERQ